MEQPLTTIRRHTTLHDTAAKYCKEPQSLSSNSANSPTSRKLSFFETVGAVSGRHLAEEPLCRAQRHGGVEQANSPSSASTRTDCLK